MTFLPIVERELIEASRRRNTYWSRVGVAAAGLIIGCWILAFPEFRTPARIGMALFIPLAIIAMIYCGLIGIFRTADCLSEEKREGTLGLLFLTDLKGYDIILGKLAATSLNAAYGLMALFPVLAIPLLAGGVSFGEFGRVVLVCANTLLFSLAIGMFCSAVHRDERRAMIWAFGLIAAFVVGLPILAVSVERFNGWRNTGLAELVSLPCPGFSAVYAFEDARRGQSGAAYFWASVGTVHALSWLFLVASSWIVPRTWQDRPLSEAALRRRQRVQELGAAPVAQRAEGRRRLLSINPILWLVSRGRFKVASVWAFLGGGVIIWVLGLTFFPRDWTDLPAYFLSALFTHTILRFWVVTEASRRFSLDRQSGALELLLSTPLPAPEMVRGQVMAIERQFAGPVLFVLLVDLVFLMAGNHNRGWVSVCVVGMLVFVADLFALTWLGMWRGLNSRRPNRAAAASLVRILFLPWVLLGLTLTVVGLSGGFGFASGRFLEEYGVPALYAAISLVIDFAYGWPARRNLLDRFRQVATERFETKGGGS